jgi:hypothetical protein
MPKKMVNEDIDIFWVEHTRRSQLKNGETDVYCFIISELKFYKIIINYQTSGIMLEDDIKLERKDRVSLMTWIHDKINRNQYDSKTQLSHEELIKELHTLPQLNSSSIGADSILQYILPHVRDLKLKQLLV